MKKEYKILTLGAIAIAATSGLLIAAVNDLSKMDRYSTELGTEVLTYSGTVTEKSFVPGRHLNFMDNGNIMADMNPLKQLTKSKDRYDITIQYQEGDITVDDRELYDIVKERTGVTIELREKFRVKKTYDGKLLEQKLDGYDVNRVMPIEYRQ